MEVKELAEKFMDGVLYDGQFIDRWHPFSDKIHYAHWLNKFETLLEELTAELGWEFFTDELIDVFTCGNQEEVTWHCELNPCLQQLNKLLNEYHEWLCETIDLK